MQSANSQENTVNQPQTNSDLLRRQPLLVVSGIGAAFGSLRAAFRKIDRLSPFNLRILPSYPRFVPKYLRSNYVKFPAIFIILLASTRGLRTILNH